MQTTASLLQLMDLSVGFIDSQGHTRDVLRNVSLQVKPGQSLGLVGESGSGKSTLALAAMAYLKPGLQRTGGRAYFEGRDLFELSDTDLQALRGGVIGMVPQNAGLSLTPTLRVAEQIDESLRLHTKLDTPARARRVLELLHQVRLPQPEQLAERYPHELSGGQQQRVAIAMALAGQPRLLLLDEPTTGLDVTTQAHVLDLLREINQQTGTAMVYVSHDLGAIARVCNRISVLYAGEVVLEGTQTEVLMRPRHPYPRGLIASIPRISRPGLPAPLPGASAAPGEHGPGCAFAPRCDIAQSRCHTEAPPLRRLDEHTQVRCHYAEQMQPWATADARTMQAGLSLGANEPPLLILNKLGVRYDKPGLWDQLWGRPALTPLTVDGVDLTLSRGRTLALVGESGSGKSSILKVIAGLLSPAEGSVQFDSDPGVKQELPHRSHSRLQRIQIVFQNPDDSLNPRHTVATLLEQPLRLYFGLSGAALEQRCLQWLEKVRLGPHYMHRLPSQMSGGEKQRVAIARAFAAEPDVVLCDEVTSALDVSVQAAVLDLLQTLKSERGTAYLMVSHDLAVIRSMADQVAVLYQGRLCEVGPAASVYSTPSHPYTEVLRGAILEPDPAHEPQLLAQDISEAGPPAQGCAFQRRCPRKLGAVCEETTPPWQIGSTSDHRIRCHIPVAQLAESLVKRRSASC